jgi:hypothetical protein
LRLVPDATTEEKDDSGLVMYARAVDEADTQLRELRHEEWGSLGLASVALALAVGASELYSALAVPLFVGGFAVGLLGVRAMWRHWDLLDRLAGDRDAYAISEVRAYASREATMARRRGYAALIRSTVAKPALPLEDRTAGLAEELEALAGELEDEALVFDPACAVVCMRLLTDPEASPLLSAERPPEDLRSRIRQIRSGFSVLEHAA